MPLMLALHPGTAFYGQPFEAGTFIEDVKRWGRMMRGQLGPDLLNAKANGTADDFSALDRYDTLAVDIETGAASSDEPWTGKDPTRARLKTIAIGTPDGGVSCMWDEADADTKRVIKLLMLDKSIRKVFHNGPWFDLRVMARHGIPVVNWEDTRDLRRALSATSRLSLRYLGSLYCDISNWKDEEEDDSKGLAFTDNLTKLQEYNAKDTIVTARVWHRMDKERGDDERVNRLYQLHKDLAVLTAKMHTRGIYVHREWRQFMHHCLLQSIGEKAALLRQAVGQEDFPCTDHGMRALIYKRHKKDGIKCFNLPDPYDKKMWTNEFMETISVDESSLLLLIVSGGCPPELVPIIEAWWDLQGEKKRLGYIKSELFDHALGPDGRLRPGWNSCGTDTGRFSCSEPNVMNIEQLLRHMLAPAPGKAIVHADKSQLELRVMAVVAADQMLQAALDSQDVYSFDARGWFQLPADFDVKKLKPSARKAAKIIHLGRQYGAGLKTVFGQALRQDRSFTISRTQLLMQQFDKMYYRTTRYWQEEMSRVLGQGYSESRILGRRRVYPRPPELSETVNYPIQATASDLMNLEILELDKRLAEVPSAHIIIQLHDAVDVECNEDDVPRVEQIIDEVMDREWTFEGVTRKFGIERKTTYSSDGGTWADV